MGNQASALVKATWQAQAHAPSEADALITIDDIVAGKAGEREAQAARQWLQNPPKEQAQPPKQLKTMQEVRLDVGPYDMRVGDERAAKRRRLAPAAPSEAVAPPAPAAGASAQAGSQPAANGTSSSSAAKAARRSDAKPAKPSRLGAAGAGAAKAAAGPASTAPADASGSLASSADPSSRPVPKGWQVVVRRKAGTAAAEKRFVRLYVAPDGTQFKAYDKAKAHWCALGQRCARQPKAAKAQAQPAPQRAVKRGRQRKQQRASDGNAGAASESEEDETGELPELTGLVTLLHKLARRPHDPAGPLPGKRERSALLRARQALGANVMVTAGEPD